MNGIRIYHQRWICLGLVLTLLMGGILPCGVASLNAATKRDKLRPKGITPAVEKSIAAGMEYLAKSQGKEGSWCGGSYGSNYPVAMTSLAGLAMLAGGNTPESGKYANNVRRAMDYILGVAMANNKANSKTLLITGQGGGESRPMYGHGFAMLFLAQCYGMEGNKESKRGKRIKLVLDKAVQLTATSQSDLGAAKKHAGGWTYSPDANSDEGSVTVTQLQALRACRNVGINVPKNTIDRAVALLIYLQKPDGGICYASRSRSSSMPALSAAAMVSFYMSGIYDDRTGGAGAEAKMVEKLAAYCKQKCQPAGSRAYHLYYTQLFMAQAMYQRGGEEWDTYFPKIRSKLLPLQAPGGFWRGESVGQVYCTSISLIILQLPYAYLPIAQR
ncbi:MAG: terpene cyclase/mutase family protein [Phycisphaerales bacterium]|jgi:hypothetical protein|nr:terpene cyclase/mutase family protein [Phycisphaerales bacterium]MBT7170257.1 terpene cyclase/mutase family protein [Phycisphaerales bacterium]